MELFLIFAKSKNGVIGVDGKLPWHLPEDLVHFKNMTDKCNVIMGSKTWTSLPDKFKPLPGRLNIVISRNPHFDAPGAVVVGSIQEALQLDPLGQERTWVIGGSEIYTLAMPYATGACVTEIDLNVEGDAMAPTLPESWNSIAYEEKTSATGIKFSHTFFSKT